MTCLMEYQEICTNCGNHIFEATEDGKCIYCGHELEEDVIIEDVV